MQPYNKPWFDNDDPLIEYYGLIDREDLKIIEKIKKKQDLSICCFSKAAIEKGFLLLDFSDFYNKNSQFELFTDLIHRFKNNKNYLLWLPLDNYESETYNKFTPIMVAKTPFEVSFLEKVSQSMMQMINGSFMVIDSDMQFVSIIIDGYYMLSVIYDGSLNTYFEKYINNLKLIDENLDEVTANSLKSCYENMLNK